jgi:hypothetical protein
MTTLLTAKQHRILAANLVKRAHSNNPTPPGKMRLLQMAENHITMANMIEARARNGNASLLTS